jgi:cytochrome c
MNHVYGFAIAVVGLTVLPVAISAQTGNVARGERAFRTCVACHSLEPNRNMTGPSLAELWNRKAGGLPSFERYSPALKSSAGGVRRRADHGRPARPPFPDGS